ncbi:MAG TPA: glycoside hydrolase family 3 C-terminal domain-containing protein [Gemmatimonadaceae bacterium]|nr:glycoside hydrolase family 3 C-terminal domain-containing protein [Gemmatimonadaceae bacterium]
MPRCPLSSAVRAMRRAVLAAAVLLPATLVAQPAALYLDRTLPAERRAADLVARMTLEEKASQLRDHADSIPHLGVPKYDWWNEAAHGVANAGHATVFPQAIGLAATWDTALVHRVGEVIATEGRAKYHEALRRGQREIFFGLTFWAPNINIFRDPRWGRGQETYGEDPFLAGRLAVAFVKGMQGDDPMRPRVVATPKHFAVHSGPEPLRHRFDVPVSSHDLEDTYLPAFRAAVTEGRARSVMCAYNAVRGVPTCASPLLLREYLRDAWRFDGYVVSDCGALDDVTTGHRYAPDPAHAAAVSIAAGTDLECGFGSGQATLSLPAAVRQGLLAEAQVDTALVRLFTARFALGMFDPPDSYAYGRIPFSVVNAPAHRAVARRAAREAIVLLRNEGDLLPLAARARRIAVVGPTASLVQALQGNYNGTPRAPVTPLAGIERRFGPRGRVTYAQGSALVDGLAIPIPHTALRTDGGAGLRGEYFTDTTMQGRPALVRRDRGVNFNWDKATPAPGQSRFAFSVRWTGTFVPPAPGEYRLGARVNNCYGCRVPESYRLFLDDSLVAEGVSPDADRDRKRSRVATLRFADTRPHALRLEYVHHTGPAGIDLTWEPPAAALRDEAVAAARQADVVVAVLGLSPELEGEEMPVKLDGFVGGDRTDIRLPAVQRALLDALAATRVPVVLVLTSGSALAVDTSSARAIVQAWYPGEEGGTAIAETLAGDVNPAGRLPVTFYASVDQLPPFEDYAMARRTYRYLADAPLYGFGFGLSYARFGYGGLGLPRDAVRAGDSVTVEVDVTNTSRRAGDEVVQVYLTPPRDALAPRHLLAAFARVHLAPGATRRVTLRIAPRTLAQVNAAGERVIVPGDYRVAVGGAQPGASAAGVDGSFTVRGPAMVLPR